MSSVQETARWYIENGFAPIPIPSGSKNPNRRNWEAERWKIEDVPAKWDNGQNIGILCGAPSKGRVDVDCDCIEAVRLAPKFLKPTLKGGRNEAPNSHWWYTSPGTETKPFMDVTGKRILELRADGCQTVVYPSVHPSGETYQWYRDDRSLKMAKIEPDVLLRQVRLLCTATLIARHMPPIGGRHDYALALAGFLLRGERLGEEETERVMVSAWQLFEDATRDATRDVEGAVKTTAERLSRNQSVRGGGALAVFSEHLTKTIANAWNWHLGNDENTVYAWGEPEQLPVNLPPVMGFDYRMLPEAFEGWVRDVTERMQVPPDFVAVPLMVVFSAIVGRKVGIRPKRYDDWLVVPNLWGAIVGRPGLLKSPALNEALAPMNTLIAKAIEACEEELEDYKAELEVHQAKIEYYNSEKKKLAKAGDMSTLKQFMDENRPEDEPEAPRAKRYLTSDTTTEKLGELLNENPDGLLVFRDELVGFLRALDKYGREGDRQFYLESWNGDQGYSVDRIGRGSLRIPALCLSILGGIQPGPLSRYVHDAGSGLTDDDGLLQRFQLLVWPDHPEEWTDVDRYPDKDAKDTVVEVFRFADNLKFEAAEDNEDIPYIRFSEEAQYLFSAWRSDLEREVRSSEFSPAVEAHKAKYRSLFPALALLIEIADSAKDGEIPKCVTETSTAKAFGWLHYLESHATRLYHSAEQPEMNSARELLKRLEAGSVGHGEPVWRIYRNNWRGLGNREEVDGALEVLTNFGWLRVHKFDSGGRPSEVVLLNPQLRRRS